MQRFIPFADRRFNQAIYCGLFSLATRSRIARWRLLTVFYVLILGLWHSVVRSVVLDSGDCHGSRLRQDFSK